ncbi:hypothetical protein RhiirB3_473165 [Rhizophagus irregularis]|nr:hypothetical protein RhiirB3_471313 [Rhizophagus irregularis]PKY26695.1 hypothetical protein RhiirB3_473165 [Rhizophagus irregularis]
MENMGIMDYMAHAKGESTIITPASETVNVEAVNVEGNAEDRMGNDFRWPTSMPQNTRDQVFWVFTDNDVTKDDQEYALNCIYFYNSLDNGMFDEHKQDWVLVYKQSVVEYGEKKSNKQRSDLDREMPGALYLPVDSLLRGEFLNPKIPAARAVLSQRSAGGGEYMIQVRVKRVGDENTNFITLAYRFNDTKNRNKLYKTVIDTGAPETILPYEVRSYLGTGWERQAVVAPGYGAPANLFLATDPFQVSIGDDNNWSRWVQTNTLRVWERKASDQVDSSLIGNDVLDQFTYVHRSGGGLFFLNQRHEGPLSAYLDNLSP